MSSAIDLSGGWTGGYVNETSVRGDASDVENPHFFPLRAVLVMQGHRFRGTMVDETPITHSSIREAYEQQRQELTPGGRTMFEDFMAAHPEAVLISTLATDSKLSGIVRGDEVTLWKRYAAPPKHRWEFGGKPSTVTQAKNLPVRYRGRLSADRGTIEGSWEIFPWGRLGAWQTPNAKGTFTLRRTGRNAP